MGVKPGYKQTEVGEIPEDWDIYEIEKNFFGCIGFEDIGLVGDIARINLWTELLGDM